MRKKIDFFNPLSIYVLRQILHNALKEQERDILDLQQEQMYAGLLDSGNPIQPDYAPYTIEQKKKKGQPTDRVTLKDSGDMYRQMFVKHAREHTEISTRSRKRLPLKRYYEDGGGDIFGLTEGNKALLAKLITPIMQEQLREYIISKIVRKPN